MPDWGEVTSEQSAMTASARAGRRSEEGRAGRLPVSQIKGRHTGSPAGRRERGAEERGPAERRRREELAEEERTGQLVVSQVKGRRCESGAAERSAPRRAGGGGSQERGCRARAWRRNRRKAWGRTGKEGPRETGMPVFFSPGRPGFTNPTGLVKPPPSSSGLPDRFDRKSVETG